MNVYIGGAKDYSAMRGPCPDGFHIPMKDEWVGVNSIMAALGNTTVNSYISKLHLHLGRFIEWQGTKYPDEPQIGYWSCTKYANNNYAYALFLYTYNGTEIVSPNQQFQKNRGFPIRPFKDTFVTPTASWTVIQGTLGSAGIFWNTTDGIISITGDGITGYTIADKDLGATTVYNNGNTKTDANCGKCYQWGNIYGFAFNSFTTSSTQVNASSYGPGNYYSSSTFVTTDPRDSSNNANLRGGATGIVSLAKLKQAYIGDCTGWEPGTNTFLYYSFDNQNLNDNSGNNRNGTWYSGAGSYTTGVKSYGANNGNRGITIPSFIAGDFTLSIWVKPTNNGLAIQTLFGSIDWSSAYGRIHLHMYNSGQSNICLGLSKDGTYSASEAITWNEWNHIVLTKISGVFRLYKNKNLILTHTYNYNNQTGGTWTIGNGYTEDRHVTGVLDEVILETRGWTQEEIQEYYDNMKSLYGIS